METVPSGTIQLDLRLAQTARSWDGTSLIFTLESLSVKWGDGWLLPRIAVRIMSETIYRSR